MCIRNTSIIKAHTFSFVFSGNKKTRHFCITKLFILASLLCQVSLELIVVSKTTTGVR